jgi:hypothetical protein
VLHSSQGARTYQELGNYFANPSSGVSSHVGIDDTPGTVGEYVRRDWKAWTAANANPWSIQAELCAFAEWDRAEWDRHPVMLENTAAWIAEEAAIFGIPLVLLDAHQAQDPYTPGVCQHADLGSMGGGHWDCGPGFPIDRVVDMAAGGGTPPDEEDEDMPPNVFIMTFIGEEGKLWMVDVGQMTKTLIPDPVTVDFLHNLGVTDVLNQPLADKFADITFQREPGFPY